MLRLEKRVREREKDKLNIHNCSSDIQTTVTMATYVHAYMAGREEEEKTTTQPQIQMIAYQVIK